MLKILAIVGTVMVVAIVGVLIIAATKPDSFRVQRSIVINAPAEKILAYVNDFHLHAQWSPFDQMDPEMKRTFRGPNSGKGAVYAWDSKGKAGAGRMEITETAPTKTAIDLDFTKPLESQNIVEFSTQPQGDAQTVTWAMSGPNLFIGKIMQVFVSMDSMVGKDFETGLANLKTIAEK